MDSEQGRLGVAQGNERGILLSYCVSQLHHGDDYSQRAPNGNGQKSPDITSLFPQHSIPSLKKKAMFSK